MTLLVEVTVAPALAERAAVNDDHDMLAASIRGQVLGLASALGIPSEIEVRVATDRADDSDLLVIRVDGKPCRFPRRLPSRAAAALRGAWPDIDDLADADGWLASTTPGEAREVVGMCCAQAIAATPSILLTDEAVVAYAQALAIAYPAGPAVAEPAVLAGLLRDVVDLRIGIGDVDRVAALLGETDDMDDVAQRTELLVAALAADTVGVLVPGPVAAQLGVCDTDDPDDLLGVVASGLFEETGLVVPRLVLEDSDGLPEGTFAVRVNDLTTLPCPLIPLDSCLVNDTPARLSLMGCDGRPATIPGPDKPGAIAPLEQSPRMEDTGLTTWTTTGHICLQLAVELRQELASVVSQDRLFAQLDILELTNPELVPAARSQLPPAALTRLVRGLARDRVPLRHLPIVLERLVDLPADGLGWERYSVVDDPVPSPRPEHEARPDYDRIQQFVRTGLRHHIVDHVSRDGVLVVYLLDHDLQTRLGAAELTEEVEELALAALRDELRHLSATVTTPVVLTSSQTRTRLQALTRATLPGITVLAHEDLPSETVVQPVARVTAG